MAKKKTNSKKQVKEIAFPVAPSITTEVPKIVKLKPEDRAKAVRLSKEIDIAQTQGVLLYGTSTQQKVSQFADSILQTVRSKDAGDIGEQLTDLLFTVRDVNVGDIQRQQFFNNLPIIGGWFDKARYFIARYDKVSGQIEGITRQLESAKLQLYRDITVLDELQKQNLQYLREIHIFIVAGKMKLEEETNQILPRLQKKAEETNDPLDIQAFNDRKNQILSFERKIHDLELTEMIAMQTAPQIRIIQVNDKELAEKIQSSILQTIPLWKNQIVLAITTLRQHKALRLQQAVTKTTNELLRNNSKMLKENSIEIAKEVERGIVDLETLQIVQSDILETIRETVQIQEDGRAKRMAVEKELTGMKNELKQKLLQMRRV